MHVPDNLRLSYILAHYCIEFVGLKRRFTAYVTEWFFHWMVFDFGSWVLTPNSPAGS